MAMLSMTGYGRGAGQAAGLGAEVEVGSVNRRQFDLRINLPRQASVLEPRIVKAVRAAITRGCVTVNVRLTGSAAVDGAVTVNMPLAREYLRAYRRLGRELKLEGDITLSALLQCPDVVERRDPAADTDRLWRAVRPALEAALDAHGSMRAREGNALRRDMEKRFRALARRRAQIERLAPAVPKRHAEALGKRIAALAPDTMPEPAVLAREVALAADRCDIAEELVRLASHFEQADILAGQPESAGRALDFLCQEMLREINTIGSKGGDAHISRHVIAFKTELERVREQVQNIE